jgi:hypothetical protein
MLSPIRLSLDATPALAAVAQEMEARAQITRAKRAEIAAAK